MWLWMHVYCMPVTVAMLSETVDVQSEAVLLLQLGRLHEAMSVQSEALPMQFESVADHSEAVTAVYDCSCVIDSPSLWLHAICGFLWNHKLVMQSEAVAVQSEGMVQ